MEERCGEIRSDKHAWAKPVPELRRVQTVDVDILYTSISIQSVIAYLSVPLLLSTRILITTSSKH